MTNIDCFFHAKNPIPTMLESNTRVALVLLWKSNLERSKPFSPDYHCQKGSILGNEHASGNKLLVLSFLQGGNRPSKQPVILLFRGTERLLIDTLGQVYYLQCRTVSMCLKKPTQL